MSKSNVLEIEVDGPRNQHLIFGPLGRRIRGRMAYNRVANRKGASDLAIEWPKGFPGQRLGIDLATGQSYIAEPLHDPEWAETREKIEKVKKQRIPPAREEVATEPPTMLFWMKKAVESGIARIVKGAFPDKIEGEPVTSFWTKQAPNQNDQLLHVLRQNNAIMQQLLAKLK